MIYRKVAQFFYNGQSYNMYLDNHNKHFFLRNELDGSLSYISTDELVELTILFNSVPLVMNAEKNGKGMKIVPKIVLGSVALTMSLSALGIALELNESNKRLEEFEKNYAVNQSVQQTFEEYVSYDDGSPDLQVEDEPLVVDTYLESDWLNYLYIYDMDYLDKALSYENVSIDQLKEQVNNSPNISDRFKDLLDDYCDSLSKYPNIDKRVFYENLKNLKVVECTKDELVKESLSMDSYGCYVRTKNTIYVLKDYDYEKGTWPYQVIFHEFSHCLRTGCWGRDGQKIKVQVEGQNFNNTITAEALNSLFTVSLFDYEERDVAYQLQSNYHSIMLDCMDNYSLEDYVNHSLSYYAKKLDEFNGDDNYATTILELIQLQYDDYHSNSISIDPSGYHPIYDYVADMYYKKNITPDMSYSDAVSVTDELVDRIMFDVPDDYNIDVEHIYSHLNEYCSTVGIDTTSKTFR